MNVRGKNKQKFGFRKRKNFDGKHNFSGSSGREFRHTQQLSEEEVGISEYISTLEGFTGVLKARYSDFHVNEINLNGEIAILTDTSIPREPKCETDFNTIDQTPIEAILQAQWIQIKDMMNSKTEEFVDIDVEGLSKEERKNIHLCLKKIFGNKLSANTLIDNDKKILKLKKSTSEDRRSNSWPEDRGTYVHFLLYKEALDTMNACYQVAEALKMKPSWFSYAGIKDRRGKTTQWFSVKQVEPWKLIMKTKKIRNIKIGNITFRDTPLKLGDLSGNRFKIVVRNVVADDSVLKQAVEHVQQHGFINYYGLQRFGNDKEVPTFSIGLHLLLGNWKQACDLILKPKHSDDPESDIAKAKKIYASSGDTQKAYNCVQRNANNCVEVKLLEGLAKEHKNDYVNALENIPRNMRLFYIHSFQSLIWNKLVSSRIEKFGLQPVENDLVVINNVFNEPDLHPSEEEEVKTETSLTEENPEIQNTRPQVKALTQSDLSQYTIFDIVLPLPGYDVVYPENMKQEYEEELQKHGLTLEMPKQSVKTYTLSGAYRKIVSRVQDMTWKIMRYNDPLLSLILSDFDILRKFQEPADIPDGKYKALILELSLDSAVYATMVLREIMKVDTAPSAQVKLNNYDNAISNQPKKIALSNGQSDEKFETIDISGTQSLLNNQEKLEAFKKSIFADIAVKRKCEEEVVDMNKKQKTETS